MSHNIFGFIGKAVDLHLAGTRLAGSKVVSLFLGYGFLPVTDEVIDFDERAPFRYLTRLTYRLGEWAEIVSADCPLAYVETDYFGGRGLQTAVAWVGGRLVFGPTQTEDFSQNGKVHPTPLLERAINQALRLIGVGRGIAIDEFAALGLGKHRSNEDWLSVPGV